MRNQGHPSQSGLYCTITSSLKGRPFFKKNKMSKNTNKRIFTVKQALLKAGRALIKKCLDCDDFLASISPDK